MTDQQLQTIVGLISGMQLAIVHLSNVVGESEHDRDKLADSFEATAQAIPEEVPNRKLMQLVLNQITRGIKSSNASPDFEKELIRLLH